MIKFPKRILLGLGIVAVNVALASSPAQAGREYEVGVTPEGKPVIICEGCWLWGCDCPDLPAEQ